MFHPQAFLPTKYTALHCNQIHDAAVVNSLTGALCSSVWSHCYVLELLILSSSDLVSVPPHPLLNPIFNSSAPQSEFTNLSKCFTSLFWILIVVDPDFNIVLEVTNMKIHLSRNFVLPQLMDTSSLSISGVKNSSASKSLSVYTVKSLLLVLLRTLILALYITSLSLQGRSQDLLSGEAILYRLLRTRLKFC